MLLTIILFVLGLLLLVKGANYLVDGASSAAKKMGISAIVIGLTIVAFGTSAPELIVNLFASYKGNTDIAIGNVLGSNIANILLILGISAAIFPLAVKKGTVWKEIPFALLAVVLMFLMANDTIIEGRSFSALTRIDGLILLSFFIIFLYYTFGISKLEANHGADVKIHSGFISSLMIVGGLLGLAIGGKFVVDSAMAITRALGVSEALIGLTVVAIGTSLPELATSAVAAYKKNADIAIGNVVGSNIFNIFWILGISAAIRPLPFSSALNLDAVVTVLTTLLLFVFIFIGRRHIVERWQGAMFIALYVFYVVYLVLRG